MARPQSLAMLLLRFSRVKDSFLLFPFLQKLLGLFVALVGGFVIALLDEKELQRLELDEVVNAK